MSLRFNKFIQLTKVDEAKREVGGIVTAQKADKEGEICHYETTVPYYKDWSAELAKATDGKNLGNLRIMHTLEAAGVGKSINFNDSAQEIEMIFKVVDDDAWKGVQEGMYTGFSQGGEYVKVWTEGGQKFYTAKPSEVSLVDNPCLSSAHFNYIKADGTTELRKFKKTEEPDMTKTEIQAMIDDAVKAAVKKPEVAKDEEMTEAKKALKAKVFETVTDICKTQAGLKKNLYDVAEFAYILCDLAWLQMSTKYEAEYEGDGSELPAALGKEIKRMADIFLQMAEEEAGELASAVQVKKGGSSTVKTQVPAEALTELVKLNAAHNASVEGLLKKILGTEEAQSMGNDEPKPIKPQGTTEDVSDAASRGAVKAMTQADVDAAVTKAMAEYNKAHENDVDKALQDILKAMSDDDEAEETAEKPAKKAAPVAGVGDRSQVVLPGAGPALKVMPVTKSADAIETAAPAAVETIDVAKAINGDTAEQIKLMKSAKVSADLPPTVAQAMGSRKR